MRKLKEADVETHLKKRALSRRALERKVQWIGRNGAPDRVVLFGTTGAALRLKELFEIIARQGSQGLALADYDILVRELVGRVIALVELKKPDVKTPKIHQRKEHKRLRDMGLRVEVIDSIEGVDALLA